MHIVKIKKRYHASQYDKMKIKLLYKAMPNNMSMFSPSLTLLSNLVVHPTLFSSLAPPRLLAQPPHKWCPGIGLQLGLGPGWAVRPTCQPNRAYLSPQPNLGKDPSSLLSSCELIPRLHCMTMPKMPQPIQPSWARGFQVSQS